LSWVYEKPPVTESVCEFRLSSDSAGDWTVPGVYYSAMRDKFPVKRQKMLREFKWAQTKEGIVPEITTGMQRIQLLSPDSQIILEAGPEILSVHRLGYATEWPSFVDLIIDSYFKFYQLLENALLKSIVLRYINEIPIKGAKLTLEDYFTTALKAPAGLPETISLFTQHIDIVFENEESKELSMLLRYIFSHDTSTKPDEQLFRLDMAVISNPKAGLPSDGKQLRTWLGLAHEHIIEAFEASFTDFTKETLFLGKEMA
jgi:uncharacterized protein (TIGR04255 family)